jgi:hypothetical protein
MSSLKLNVKTKKFSFFVSQFLRILLLPLLLPAFLLDLILFFLSEKGGCVNCGIKDIVESGVFIQIILKKYHHEQPGGNNQAGSR